VTAFARRGKAKAEARARRGEARNRNRFERKLAAVRGAAWPRLQALAGKTDHGRATLERFLEFCSKAPSVEQAERVVHLTARWAMGQADPIAALNNQLNEAEKAEDARPKVDPAWLPKAETTENAPEAAQENV
jgi:hypothetical protein